MILRSKTTHIPTMFRQIIVLVSAAAAISFSDIRAGSSYRYPGSTGGVQLHDKIGWGNCPDVKPVKDFNIRGIYGKWYTVAQYSEPSLEGQRCKTMEISNGDEEELTVPCRVNVTYRYIDTKTGKSVTQKPAFIFAANDKEELSYTMKFTDGPSWNWYPIATDYDNLLAGHSCEEFPGPTGFPWPFRFYTQHNYLMHRKPEAIKDFDEINKFYTKLGISTEPFKQIEPDCKI